MSIYVELATVKDGTRDKLLENSVAQGHLDRAEQLFLSLVKDRELDVSDISVDETGLTDVEEVKEYIISATFYLCAKSGENINVGRNDQKGNYEDPYLAKKKSYLKEMDELAMRLTASVIAGDDSTLSSRRIIPRTIRV